MPFDIYNYIVNDFNIRQMHYDGVIKEGLDIYMEPGVMNTVGGLYVPDISGNDKRGVRNNGAFFSPNNSGVIVYDGNNDYVDTISSHDDLGNLPVSVFCWVYSTDYTHNLNGADYENCICSKRSTTSSSTNNHWELTVKNSLLSFKAWNSSNSLITNVSLGSTLSENTWYYVGFTTDGASSGAYNIYVDGAEIGSGTLSGQRNTGSELITLGQLPYNKGFIPWKGRISTFVVYNKVLSPDEVLMNYNAQKARFEKG